ncbi:ABC transporter permease [Paenibacillus macerans]|uniref:ABC transporter permease n=1 Tax=Paenibacillus macerans TaxID=44252 RepID=UPI003D31827C
MRVLIKKQAVNLLKTFMFPIAVYLGILIVTLLMGKTGYISVGAFDRIVRGSVLTTITAYAIALPLSGGRWDFAPGIIIMLAGIIGSNLTIDLGLGPVMLLAITIAVAILLSLFEGLLYLWIRVPTIIVSLGVVMMYEAVSGVVFGGSGTQLFMHANLTVFARPPLIYIVLALIMVLFYYLLSHTKFGYDTRSLSANPRLAVNMGVNEKKNMLLTYLVVGALLGVAAVLNASTVLVSPAGNLSSTALMFSSMAPVLMGLYLAQFTNLPLGIFAGALGMNALSYGMVVLGINSSLQTVIVGVFIVVFMAYTTNQERIRSYLNRMKTGSRAQA